MNYPSIYLFKKKDERVKQGYPWIYANEIDSKRSHKAIIPGDLACVYDDKHQFLGIASYNSHSLIVARFLTRQNETIDESFFKKQFMSCLELRNFLFEKPFYRLVHGDADKLPGLIVDRFDDVLSIQINSQFAHSQKHLWLPAILDCIKPKSYIIRKESNHRLLEGLQIEDAEIYGTIPDDFCVIENDLSYVCDLISGQKTGWFFDQRDNRKLIANAAKNKTILDCYTHTGGFGLLAAKAGAQHVTLVDRSAESLELAKKTALKNGLDDRCTFIKGDAFDVMQDLAQEKNLFDVVIVDPPAFIKRAKDTQVGYKGYEKVTKFATPLVKKNGLLFAASCSYHAQSEQLQKTFYQGINAHKRSAVLLKQTFAAGDHPVHPMLPESSYLKGFLFKLDH